MSSNVIGCFAGVCAFSDAPSASIAATAHPAFTEFIDFSHALCKLALESLIRHGIIPLSPTLGNRAPYRFLRVGAPPAQMYPSASSSTSYLLTTAQFTSAITEVVPITANSLRPIRVASATENKIPNPAKRYGSQYTEKTNSAVIMKLIPAALFHCLWRGRSKQQD
jgi:hypothetical protein